MGNRVRTRSFRSVFRKPPSKQSSFSIPDDASDKAFVGYPNMSVSATKTTITHRINSRESSKRSTPESEIRGFRESGKNKLETGAKSNRSTYFPGNNAGEFDSPASIRKEKQLLSSRSKSSKPVSKSELENLEAILAASETRAKTPLKWLHDRSNIQSTSTLENDSGDSPQMSHLILTLDVPAQENLSEGEQGEKDAESQLTALPPLTTSTADINNRTANLQHHTRNSSSSFLSKSSPLSTLRSHKKPHEGSGSQSPESRKPGYPTVLSRARSNLSINPAQVSTLPSLQLNTGTPLPVDWNSEYRNASKQTENTSSRERLGLGIHIDKGAEIREQFCNPTSISPTSSKSRVTTLERGVEPSEGRLAMKQGYGVGAWLVYRKQSAKRLPSTP